jgi:hypothetical protein
MGELAASACPGSDWLKASLKNLDALGCSDMVHTKRMRVYAIIREIMKSAEKQGSYP